MCMRAERLTVVSAAGQEEIVGSLTRQLQCQVERALATRVAMQLHKRADRAGQAGNECRGMEVGPVAQGGPVPPFFPVPQPLDRLDAGFGLCQGLLGAAEAGQRVKGVKALAYIVWREVPEPAADAGRG